MEVDAGVKTISSVIADGASAGDIVKTGSGTLVLSGANTYSGGTVLDAGVLELDVAEVFVGGALVSGPAGTGGISFAGRDPVEAVVGSAVRRFRPIMLTAAAASLALIPIARSILWGPLAFAMMGGIFVATILTILVLPAAYAFFFRLPRLQPASAATQNLRVGAIGAG